MKSEIKEKVKIDDLAVGLYIDLEKSWTEHPFLFSRFKIKTEKQLSAIRQLGMSEVIVIPELSDINTPIESTEQHVEAEEVSVDEMWEAKQERINKAEEFRQRRKQVEKNYRAQAEKMRKVTKELRIQPANAVQDVDELIEGMVDSFISNNDLLTNLVNLGSDSYNIYNHSLNVTVLSLALGSSVDLSAAEMKNLGMGALLHDIGKMEIPDRILMKTTKLNTAEYNLYKKHAELGRTLTERVKALPAESLDIIDQHHEYLDGSGFPYQLKDKKISELVRIVTIANTYDNLCNPSNPDDALEPKVALALMFTRYKDKLDNHLVQSLVRNLGVYPPGTVVKLNDNSIGLVVCVDPKNLTNPEIIVYNPDIPSDQALHINLTEHENLEIVDALRPESYPEQIHDYLGIEERSGYYFE